MNAPHSAGQRFRILLIEDELDIARLILHSLSLAGFDCRYAPDGDSGLAAFWDLNPHLVLLDLMLPGMNGDEICAKIRETSTVPIIVLTAKGGEDAIVHGFKMGADDYISKPFNPKVLTARVIAQLRRVYRYDVEGAEEETASPDRPSSTLPDGWLSCEACGYMGPTARFESRGDQGQRTLICPNCHQTTGMAFTIS
ncbi:MAG: response regulator transcription factor [Armatimonadota bacterium]|nr:response regulator transcription factor [Armatimonadota bacterium]